jgi:hemerythrin-like domain-containing protein
LKITDRFIGDHKTFKKLIKDIDALAASETPDQKRLVRFVELFNDHLLLHDWGEKTFFYSAVAAKAGTPPLTKEYMRRLDEEHAHIDAAGRRMEDEAKATPAHSGWKASYDDFKRALMAHMDKEEGELFPLSETLLGVPALEEISKDVERRRSEAPKIRRHSSF